MPSLKPQIPSRADHRFIHKMVSITLGSKVEYRPSEFDRVARVFSRMGGSWERIFRGGSPQDVNLVKKIIKAAFKSGYLSKKEGWN
tara:strand:+ start:27189 stop:27446 length:258 start_codon:yes stop_codon:yes gene_type:complete